MRKTASAFITILTVALIASCSPRYEPSILDVRVINRSSVIIDDIEIENSGLLYSSPSLFGDETWETRLPLSEDNEMFLRYSDPNEGDVVKTIRIPARRTDGGELDIEIFNGGFVKPSSRFDLYNERAADTE